MREIFFEKILIALPSIILPLYIAAKLTLYFSYTRKVQKRWNEIRNSVITYWEKEYKTIGALLNSKTSEEILVIAKENRGGKKYYVICLCFFSAFSIISIVFGCLPSSFFATWLYPTILGAYLVITTIVCYMTYYEYCYYSTIEDLYDKQLSENDNKR